MSRQTFVEQWTHEQGIEFKLAEPEEPSNICEYALPFADWCNQLVETTNKDKSDITVNVALLDLVTKYMEWYASAPLEHKNHSSTRNRKKCLFHLFVETFLALNAMRLAIIPPRFREPPKPPPPQTIERGIFLGEDVGGLSDLTE